ncbi:hypothetical protein Z517_09041 [Fonsecaea pedrosoi CBS 271.37]|uniref:Uncharacterized protein n=1 Tax=Fonsecaea pedrosoi CBS 271.37 TaxID=1442368 RepID=A0A0D2EQL7_9EURO|nr:uncharacterized protein Z517_09041 [Fonsecaea pedrosoi CBS 271.37]KIW76597.1 hypothetical protein Z517_09041 [Fonsecaea pedrosoi CBS 271.37]
MESLKTQESQDLRHDSPPVAARQYRHVARVVMEHSVCAQPEETYKPELQGILLWLRTQQCRLDVADGIEFFLPSEQYRQFQELMQNDEFVEAKVKYDYSSDHETLTFRMAGHRHETLADYLKLRLGSFINKTMEHPEPAIAAFASSLMQTGSAQVKYPSRNGKGGIERRPDLTVINQNTIQYPVMIGEVAVSQTTQALDNLAREYVESTDGQIRTVIGLDVDDRMGAGVRISVWRAKFGENGKFEGVACDDSVEVRSIDGIKNPHDRIGLSLFLEDFALGDELTSNTIPGSVTMTLQTDDLYAMVEKAEAVEKAMKALWAQRKGG